MTFFRCFSVCIRTLFLDFVCVFWLHSVWEIEFYVILVDSTIRYHILSVSVHFTSSIRLSNFFSWILKFVFRWCFFFSLIWFPNDSLKVCFLVHAFLLQCVCVCCLSLYRNQSLQCVQDCFMRKLQSLSKAYNVAGFSSTSCSSPFDLIRIDVIFIEVKEIENGTTN